MTPTFKTLLAILAVAATGIASDTDSSLTPNQNLASKCSKYNDRKTCSFGVEMDLAMQGGNRWTGLYVYDDNCVLLADYNLGGSLALIGNFTIRADRMPVPLWVTDWQTGAPWARPWEKYDGHIEFVYSGKKTTSDLASGVRQGRGGNHCNCYAGNGAAVSGGNCDRDVCCGCAFDCSGNGGIKEVDPRPKGYFGEVEKHSK